MFRKLDFKPRLSYCYENITDGYSSGQRGKTVNFLPLGFESSNLSPSTTHYMCNRCKISSQFDLCC